MQRVVVNTMLAVVFAAVAIGAHAQTCQVIGQMIFCQPAAQPDFSFLLNPRVIDPLEISRRATELRLIQQQAEMQRLQLDAMRRVIEPKESHQPAAKADNCHALWDQWNHAPTVAVRQTITNYARAVAPQCGF